MSNDKETLTTAVLGLTLAVERLCDLLEAQQKEKVKPRRVEWHDTYHEDTPFSVLEGWGELPIRYRNALRNVGCITFGELSKREDMRIENFGKGGVEKFRALLERDGVLIEYFPVLN